MRSKLLPAYCIPRLPPGRTLAGEPPGRPLKIEGIVVHYFSGHHVDEENQFDLDVCRQLFMDLNRPKARREWYMTSPKWPEKRLHASAHVLIGRDGEVWKLVEFDRQAYHAGTSMLNNRKHCNQWTLGIELVGMINSGFAKAQYEALCDLWLMLEYEHRFPRENVAGHDTVRWAAIQAHTRGKPPKNKYDPSGSKDGKGDNFDWFYLGKMMNDRVHNPAGVIGLESLDKVLEADPNSG